MPYAQRNARSWRWLDPSEVAEHVKANPGDVIRDDCPPEPAPLPRRPTRDELILEKLVDKGILTDADRAEIADRTKD